MFGLPFKFQLIGAGLILLVASGWILHLKHSWQEEAYNNGKTDQQLVSSAEIAKQTQLAAQQFKAQQEIIDAGKAEIIASRAERAVLVQALRDLKIQQRDAAAQVAQLPDSAIKTDLEIKAGGPLEDVNILRRIDDAYTQYPIVVQRVDKLELAVDKMQGELDSTNKTLAATEKQRDDIKVTYNLLVNDNRQLRELLNRPKRRVWCLWICKTKDKLVLPASIN